MPIVGTLTALAGLYTIVYRRGNGPAATLAFMVGDELRKAREEAGLTQEKLAFRAGLSRPYVSQLERDMKSPTLDALFRLCDALGVRASELVGRIEVGREPRR
jgi:transcriptional regulator with XRE-family HTH domain